DLNVDVPKKTVKGRATIDVAALRDIESIRFDAVDLDTSHVGMTRDTAAAAPPDSAATDVQYVNDGKSITIACQPPLKKGQKARISIDYSLEDPTGGLHFFAPSGAE